MPTAAVVAAALVVAWAALVLLVVVACRRELSRLWREPVLRHPVLVLESDDWGAGPLAQAPALRQIAAVLDRHRDVAGRAPVMSLALVLAVPDGPAIRRGGGYRSVMLDDARFAPVLAALRDGAARGVFALQLHGLEHYWPPSLMASADPAVRAWLEGEVPATTERLPSHLQSRWVDATRLPSTPLPAAAVRAAAAAEVEAYARIVSQPPRVVVPPTFVWTRETERAWAAAGIEIVATPGWRYPRRDAQGLPAGEEGPIAGGDRAGALAYLTRVDYFEPVRGRDASHAVGVLERCVTECRACVLENHRDNFIGEAPAGRDALDELDALYREALARHRDLRFLSSEELGCALRDRDPQWLITNLRERLPALWQRLRGSGRPWKLARLCGLALVGGLVVGLLAKPAGATAGPRS